MPHADIRANLIRGCNLGETFSGGEEEKDLGASSDVDAPETHSFNGTFPGTQDTAARRHQKGLGAVPSGFKKQKDLFSGPLLPSDVCSFLPLAS